MFSDNNEFQLITWSKDKSLRFWPIDQEVMQVSDTIVALWASADDHP